ncbi:polysaccharide pyruvyl transferase family protein [Candidatus Magnetobacterium casense]|uniref:Polysaccharide pyruvyl transferase family protein n=1 Tax=Candidatus Magnetobacterium casense TaxID=1455061 RepID=A0ABS6RWT9_9BACT|nr:polysaccharide pyruvyl transferase family protein [Candidatus Magnetobacterium casensis]MBV6340263.1 polysaccharide pyruvyl transferase family protein [Candidatus Magnetobacterium casensis]
MKIHVAFSGLGAGNIGDEAMMQGFLSIHPLPEGTTIEVWDKDEPVLRQFPAGLRFVNYRDEATCDRLYKEADVVLIVGTTIVSEMQGTDWPLTILGQKYKRCHTLSVPCHAVGVGADLIRSHEGRQLFTDGFSHITSWTLRSTRSRDNIAAMGVAHDRVLVAADLAWLTPLEGVDRDWAQSQLQRMGWRSGTPLVGVNLVNERWHDNESIKAQFAHALDNLAQTDAIQIAFMCNEVRDEQPYDKAAALSVVSRMKSRPIMVPNTYFTPQQMIALLSFCDVTVSWRYHFTLLSFLAGAYPLSVIRGEKLQELSDDIGTISLGVPESITAETLARNIRQALCRNEAARTKQNAVINIMRQRSKLNDSFIKKQG